LYRHVTGSERLFKAEVENSSSENGSRQHVLSAAPDLNRRRLMQRAKMKSLRISVVIVVAFLIWWMPYYFMMIYHMITKFGNPKNDPVQVLTILPNLF
jgi:gonadotropin-releasing hormone receptor